MIVQYLLLLLLLIVRDIQCDQTMNISGEIDSIVSFPCEIDQLTNNAVITWVYRPKIPIMDGIQWLPLYANGRRLNRNNERIFVDFNGYNERTKKYLSILTINHLKTTDEGVYMCRSNQHQSIPFIFNLTIAPSMKILPKDGILHLHPHTRSLNLTCTVRALSPEKINPFQLKWYHNHREITSPHLKKKFFFDDNQATLILFLEHFIIRNHSDVFQCIYENGKARKYVRILSSTSSIIDYSKSIGRRISSNILCVLTVLFFFIN